MPLLDHFGPPFSDRRGWDGFHGAWPAFIVMALNRRLPAHYAAEPRVRLGSGFEIDIGTTEASDASAAGVVELVEAVEASGARNGGAATAAYAPPRPTLDVQAVLPDEDEYEVRVYERSRPRRLVAAVQIVSPANKDRPASRRAFVAKCATLIARNVSVAIVDVVTVRPFNLYADLLALIDLSDPSLAGEPAPLYAAACRRRRNFFDPDRSPLDPAGPGIEWRLEGWAHRLAVGRPLPTLPLWLSETLAVPLDLEATYAETRAALRLE